MHADRPRTGPCVVLVNESLVRGQVVSVVVVRTVRTTRFTNLRVPPPPPFPPLPPHQVPFHVFVLTPSQHLGLFGTVVVSNLVLTNVLLQPLRRCLFGGETLQL